MPDNQQKRKTDIKTGIKESRPHSDAAKRTTGKGKPSHPTQQRSSPSRTQQSPHSYSNYEREGDITVEIQKNLLTDITPPTDTRKRTPPPVRRAPTEKQGTSSEKSNIQKKKAARSVEEMRSASAGKTNVFSRVTVAVSTKSEKRRIKYYHTVREKFQERKEKNEKRRQRILLRRRSTAIGRFFLDDGARYTNRSVYGKQKVTSVDRAAQKLSDFLYSNRVAKKLGPITQHIRFCEARSYGITFIIFGLCALLSYFASAHLPIPYTTDVSTLVAAILTIALSIPLLLSRASISSLLEKSLIIGNLFFDLFGLRRSGSQESLPTRPVLAVVLGVFLGVLGFFVSPVLILGILAIAGVCALVLSTPEFGLSLLAFSLPFLALFEHPTIILCIGTGVCYISYLRKLALGKRSFQFRPADLFILLFSLFYLFGGIFSFAEAKGNALVCFCVISVYFLVSNLMTNKRTLDTVIRSLMASGIIVSLIGLLQQFGGHITHDWLDSDAYRYISGRIDSTFDNPNVLAAFLILLIPFCVYYLFDREKPAGAKVFGAVTLVASCCTLVFTWSRGAWVGIAVAFILFLVFLFRRSPKLTVAIFAIIPNALLFAPDSVWSRIRSIFSVFGAETDSSISYRLTVWRDCLRMLGDNLLGGVGVGRDAFAQAYSGYNSIGAEVAEHSHNLYLQIGIEVGVFALVLFVLALAYTLKSCYSMEFAANSTPVRGACLASFCAIVAFLVNGMTDYVWYNYRICFLFWLILGLCNASYRIATEQQRYNDFMQARISSFASVDVPYKK